MLFFASLSREQTRNWLFDPRSNMLAAGTPEAVRVWDYKSGRLIVRFITNGSLFMSVAFNPQGPIVAALVGRTAVRTWHIAKATTLRTLEGHTDAIGRIAFSSSGKLLASHGNDSLRIWNHKIGKCVAMLPDAASHDLAAGLAFHPTRPLLASVGSEPGTSDKKRDRVIYIWELDFPQLLKQHPTPVVNYTSAKIVLVGESNVGKSYLAHRIATGKRPRKGSIKSTHGMKFWPIEPERLSSSIASPASQRRDIVLWDMGGQDEYRLVHQLFLHDTTMALVLLDPTRGQTAFDEVEAWNKRLEKQLLGRPAVKLLVGAKMDKPSKMVDSKGLDLLRRKCGFSNYNETSALNGRGMEDLCRDMAGAIDWDNLGKTSRPELFQRIRDIIEARRKRGQVVLHLADLHRSLGDQAPTEEEISAVNAVTEQLASQGVIARSRVSSGEAVLVLQIQEIERYAGSLILAARNNPRGVPALELRAIGQADFSFPEIDDRKRLPRDQERPVLESTVQLLLEHGICFQHEGLLVFPTLFSPAPVDSQSSLQHAVSLYYDFAGAIDNVYASLVAWLVLARNFGRVRLWPDRAEFETGDRGLCGLRKVGRPGGFAHVDVYFHEHTPSKERELFISFVEEHLRLHGVEIREHIAIACPCGHKFEEETIRQRIARGDKDVPCPVCETRHNLVEGAGESRHRDPEIEKKTWALKTEIEKRRHSTTEQAVAVIERVAEAQRPTGPIRLLHLSDLHFTAATPVAARLQWLLDDLKQKNGLAIDQLDYLVISGDFTDKGRVEGFEKAYEFVSGLTKEFALSAERCIFVPGNHDVKDLQEAYDWQPKSGGMKPDDKTVVQGDIVLLQNPEKYPLRLKSFSDGFYHKFLQKPYPTDYAAQGIAIPFWETGIQFLTLNSCWQIDAFNRKRSGINPTAAAQVVKDALKQEDDARKSDMLSTGKPVLRIAVWHHSVNGPEQMRDIDFIGHLQKIGVRIALHGDVHEMKRELFSYWAVKKKMHVVGSGSFGALAVDRPESIPRLYNVLEISRDLKSARVYTRSQPKPDGPWQGWNEWDRPDGGDGAVPYYDINW